MGQTPTTTRPGYRSCKAMMDKALKDNALFEKRF